MSDWEAWMTEAITEARKGLGKTHPNPTVGALVVHDGKIVARGHTQPVGKAHAEIEALRAWKAAGSPLNGTTTLLVTLEPCSTHGRTPPCTDAIMASGIRRVVVGATDPNRAHAGAGFGLMEASGIEVISGILAENCEDLNLIFNHWIQRGKPLLALKAAVTLDGKMATRTGSSQWITGAEARQDVAQWRRYFPAIGVGAGTVLTDNPSLTSRVEGDEEWSPRRLIFDRSMRLKERMGARVFTDGFANQTVWIVGLAKIEEARDLAPEGVELWPWTDWDDLKKRCLEAALYGLYLEGGQKLLVSLFEAQAADYLFLYRAPKLLADEAAPNFASGVESGRMDEAWRLSGVERRLLGDDDLIRGWLDYCGRR